MDNKFVSIGFKGIVNRDRVVSVLSTDGAPVKRTVNTARDVNQLVDATSGRKAKCAIILDNGYIVLCGLNTDTIKMRLNLNDVMEDKDE